MKQRRSRRDFLKLMGKGLGGVAAAPILSGLLPRIAMACEGTCPLRFFLLFTGNGQHPEHWTPPSGGETDFTFAPVLAPLEPMRSKLLLLKNFYGDSSHSVGMSGTTTGRPSTNGDGIATGGPSIDQYFADLWHGNTPLHSLELGVMPANDPSDQIIYSARGLPIPPIGTGLGAFERIFAVTNEDPLVAQARRAHKKSVLDSIAADLSGLEGRLGKAPRRLLDEHLTLIREQELDLSQPFTPTNCPLHDAPTKASGLVQTWDDHNNTLVAAFRCDSTRVASMRVGGWGGIESGGYNEIGIDAGHHNAAHGGSADPYNDLLGINRFHSEQLTKLLTALDAVPEGDTGDTLLDNTVVVWVNEFGLGEFNHHGRDDVHVVMAGGKNAGMANGRYRQVNMEYGHFLYTLTHLLGETQTTQFGDVGNTLASELFA